MKIVIQGSKEVTKRIVEIPHGTVFAGKAVNLKGAIDSLWFRAPCGALLYLSGMGSSTLDNVKGVHGAEYTEFSNYREVEVIFNVPAAG